MKVKSIKEFFDTEDWKDKYEIPYIKGEMGKEISKFQNLPFSGGEETTETYYEKVIAEYPVLARFKAKVVNMGGDKMIGMFGTSYKPVEEQGYKLDFYAQLGIYYSDGYYGIHVILRNLHDMNYDNWEVREYEVENTKEAFEIIDSFMMACDKLNIIKPEDKFSIRRN
jgi:hypothetical protein